MPPEPSDLDDAFLAEVARLRAAAETLRAIEVACVGGIPADGIFTAASCVVAAYMAAVPYPSPFRVELGHA